MFFRIKVTAPGDTVQKTSKKAYIFNVFYTFPVKIFYFSLTTPLFYVIMLCWKIIYEIYMEDIHYEVDVT